MQFKFGMPKQELEEPLDPPKQPTTEEQESEESIDSPPPELPEQLTTKKLEIVERDKDRKEKRYFSAFKLIVGCLIFLSFIYITEVIVSIILKSETSNVTDGIIEIIKTLLFTLSGYLFARKENGD